jgi:hypothetical protein
MSAVEYDIEEKNSMTRIEIFFWRREIGKNECG